MRNEGTTETGPNKFLNNFRRFAFSELNLATKGEIDRQVQFPWEPRSFWSMGLVSWYDTKRRDWILLIYASGRNTLIAVVDDSRTSLTGYMGARMKRILEWLDENPAERWRIIQLF